MGQSDASGVGVVVCGPRHELRCHGEHAGCFIRVGLQLSGQLDSPGKPGVRPVCGSSTRQLRDPGGDGPVAGVWVDVWLGERVVTRRASDARLIKKDSTILF